MVQRYCWYDEMADNVIDGEQIQLQSIVLRTEYAAMPDSNESEEDNGHETAGNKSPHRLLLDIPTARQSVFYGTADLPVTALRGDERFGIVPSPANSPSAAILAPSAGYASSTQLSPIETSANSMSANNSMRLGA